MNMIMRIKLIFLACMLLVLGPSMEAKPFQNMMTSFYKFSHKLIDMGAVTSSVVEKNPQWHYINYKFCLPKEKIKLVQDFENKVMKPYVAFSYKSVFRQAGTGGAVESIGYGENNSQSYALGSYTNRNYDILYVRDGNNKSKRYVYAFVWYIEEGNVCGSLIEFYGLDPVIQRKQVQASKQQEAQDFTGFITDSIQIDGKWIGRNYNGLANLGDYYKNSAEVLSAIASISAAYNLLGSQMGEKVAKSKAEIVQYKLVLANRLVSICSVYGRKLLTKNDRTTSLRILRDLKSSEPTIAIDTLLGTAITLLNY